MRLCVMATAAAAIALLAGCAAPEDGQQREARQVAERWAGARSSYTGEAHCTDAAKGGWFVERETQLFLCAARLEAGNCDWLQVTFRRSGPFRSVEVSLRTRHAGCVLPL